MAAKIGLKQLNSRRFVLLSVAYQNCTLCGLAKGRIPASIVHEDKEVISFLDDEVMRYHE
jgi:hypothetical protein